jgi:hypothetical protein
MLKDYGKYPKITVRKVWNELALKIKKNEHDNGGKVL